MLAAHNSAMVSSILTRGTKFKGLIMLDKSDFLRIIDNISYKEEWEILLRYDQEHPYIQIVCMDGVCNVTGEPLEWSSRKWFVSPHMRPNEFVRTIYKAIVTAEMHELDEKFKYKGVAIFDPHMDLDLLADAARDWPLQERPNGKDGV
jgi:hypothetical protein